MAGKDESAYYCIESLDIYCFRLFEDIKLAFVID